MSTLEGRSFSLAEAEKTHRAVVILFISTICPYSNYYNELMRDMAAEFGRKGVEFVGVNSGNLETADEARAHARQHGHAFDIIKDPGNRIADLLGASRTPEAFLLDSSGTLRYHGRIASKISAPDLKTAIESLLEGKPIHPAETKAFGCAIVR
jgi:peroxiredoxin